MQSAGSSSLARLWPGIRKSFWLRGGGGKVSKDKIREREGWAAIDAVRTGHIYEVRSSYILQPGPASVTEGVRQLHAILASVVNCEPATGLEPLEPLDPDVARRGAVAREDAARQEIRI